MRSCLVWLLCIRLFLLYSFVWLRELSCQQNTVKFSSKSPLDAVTPVCYLVSERPLSKLGLFFAFPARSRTMHAGAYL